MGFCIGGKACRRQACKDRCKAKFSGMPEVERACKNVCKGNSSFDVNTFLCSGEYYDHTLLIPKYGIDLCPDLGIGVDEFLDPLEDRKREEEQVSRYSNVLGIGVVLILIALIILYRLVKR